MVERHAEINWSNELPQPNIALFSYTGREWNVQTRFGLDFHIPKQETTSISTCAPGHLLCELQLRKAFAVSAQYVSHDIQCTHQLVSLLNPHPFKDVGYLRAALSTMRWFSAYSLTGAAYTRVPPLWSSGQSSWLQIRRPGFDSRHYKKK
jgi:hypothetical protein